MLNEETPARWEVRAALEDGDLLAVLLKDGWEPFGTSTEADSGLVVYHLRRQAPEEVVGLSQVLNEIEIADAKEALDGA